MRYKKQELAEIYRELEAEGVEAVVIGDTVVQLALGLSELEGDIDLFVLSPSPLVEREFYREIAERKSWELAATEIGTPALVVPLSEGLVAVELYENYMDIEIPEDIVEDAQEHRIDGVKLKAIKPEHYVVLKARQGVDLDKLRKHLGELKRRGLNLKLVEWAISLYLEDERETIRERLRGVGLEI